MVSAKKLIEFLQAITEADIPSDETTAWLNSNIVGISLDRDAGEGELAWISSGQMKRHPERLNSFRGSLLLGPKELPPLVAPPAHYVACLNPKLAFIRVVAEFFPDLTQTIWPENAAQAVAPDASIAEDARLAAGVVIGSGVVIESGVRVGPNTVIANCTIGRGSHIGANCAIGFPGFGYEKDANGKYWRFPHIGRVVIEEDVEIGSNTCIDRGSLGDTIIKSGAKIDNLVHLAHNVVVGSNSLVIANSMIGGSTVIEEDVWIAPSVSVMNQVSIGKSAILGMGAVVIKDVAEAAVMVGNPAKALEKKIG